MWGYHAFKWNICAVPLIINYVLQTLKAVAILYIVFSIIALALAIICPVCPAKQPPDWNKRKREGMIQILLTIFIYAEPYIFTPLTTFFCNVILFGKKINRQCSFLWSVFFNLLETFLYQRSYGVRMLGFSLLLHASPSRLQ